MLIVNELSRVRIIPLWRLIPETIAPNDADTDTGCDIIKTKFSASLIPMCVEPAHL